MTSQFIDGTTREGPGGILYKLIEGPKLRQVDLRTTEATEKVLIRAKDVEAFFAAAMPPPILFLEQIDLPLRWRLPGLSDSIGLAAESLEAEPWNPGLPGDPFKAHGTAPEGTYAELYSITIEYSTRRLEGDALEPRTFLEHSLNTEAEFLRMTPSGVEYTSPGEDPSVNPIESPDKFKEEQNPLQPIIKLVPHVLHTLKWRFVIDPNWDAIFDLIGKVNNKNERLIFSGIDTPKEEVLFLGVSGEQQHLWNGANAQVQPWELNFHFDQRRIKDGKKRYHWNHEWSDTAKGWQRVFRTNLEDPSKPLPLYELGNFDDLWKRPKRK